MYSPESILQSTKSRALSHFGVRSKYNFFCVQSELKKKGFCAGQWSFVFLMHTNLLTVIFLTNKYQADAIVFSDPPDYMFWNLITIKKTSSWTMNKIRYFLLRAQISEPNSIELFP